MNNTSLNNPVDIIPDYTAGVIIPAPSKASPLTVPFTGVLVVAVDWSGEGNIYTFIDNMKSGFRMSHSGSYRDSEPWVVSLKKGQQIYFSKTPSGGNITLYPYK